MSIVLCHYRPHQGQGLSNHKRQDEGSIRIARGEHRKSNHSGFDGTEPNRSSKLFAKITKACNESYQRRAPWWVPYRSQITFRHRRGGLHHTIDFVEFAEMVRGQGTPLFQRAALRDKRLAPGWYTDTRAIRVGNVMDNIKSELFTFEYHKVPHPPVGASKEECKAVENHTFAISVNTLSSNEFANCIPRI